MPLRPDISLPILAGFLVEGEGGLDTDELDEWRAANPDFATAQTAVDDAEVVADNFSPYAGGGEVKLFSTREAADRYGKTDAAIASGMRSIVEVLYVEPPTYDDFTNDDDADAETFFEQWHDHSSDAVAVLNDVVCYPNDDRGRALIQAFVEQMKVEGRGSPV